MRQQARDVAVVVPVGGVASAWPRAARSLARLDPPPGEIIVFIDGPDAGAGEIAESIGAAVLQGERPRGPAFARNRAAQAATCSLLLFVDSDVEVPADLAARVSEIFRARPALAAVMGSYDASPSERATVSQYRNLLHHFVHQTAREEASTFWAGCGAVRRDTFFAVGGFSEAFSEPSIEDIELGTRIVASGGAIRLERTLQVTHLKRWRLRDMLATDLWRRAVPWTQLMLRRGRMVNDLNVKTGDRVSVVFAVLGAAAIAGVWWSPYWIVVSVASVLLASACHLRFFRFLQQQRGVLFAVRAVPLHWMYLLVCAAGFGIGAVRHLSGSGGALSRADRASAPPRAR